MKWTVAMLFAYVCLHRPATTTTPRSVGKLIVSCRLPGRRRQGGLGGASLKRLWEEKLRKWALTACCPHTSQPTTTASCPFRGSLAWSQERPTGIENILKWFWQGTLSSFLDLAVWYSLAMLFRPRMGIFYIKWNGYLQLLSCWSLVLSDKRLRRRSRSVQGQWPSHAHPSFSQDLVFPGHGMQMCHLSNTVLFLLCRARGKTRVGFCVQCKHKIGQFAFTPNTYASHLYSFHFTHRDSSHINVTHNIQEYHGRYQDTKLKVTKS